jgi:hypothetical protein
VTKGGTTAPSTAPLQGREQIRFAIALGRAR